MIFSGIHSLPDFLDSNLFGSIIGLASLVISIFTLATAEKINKEVEKIKIEAFDDERFSEKRHVWMQRIKEMQYAVETQQQVEQATRSDLHLHLTDMLCFTNVFDRKDITAIKNHKLSLESLLPLEEVAAPNMILRFREIMTGIENILEKGKYKK